MCQIPVFHLACQGSVITAQPILISSFLCAWGQSTENVLWHCSQTLNQGLCELLSSTFPQVLNSRSALFLRRVCVCVGVMLLGISSCCHLKRAGCIRRLQCGLLPSPLRENQSFGYTNINEWSSWKQRQCSSLPVWGGAKEAVLQWTSKIVRWKAIYCVCSSAPLLLINN